MNKDTTTSLGTSFRKLRRARIEALHNAQIAVWTIRRNDLMESGKTLREALTEIRTTVTDQIKTKPQLKQEITRSWNFFIHQQH